MVIKLVSINSEFTNEKGEIARIINQSKFHIKAVLRIASKVGTVRGNHYHKKAHSYIYVESGKCEYSEKPAGKPNAKIKTVVLEQGNLVFTNPGVIHAVKFLEDTVLYEFTTKTKRHYESDTVRVKIIK